MIEFGILGPLEARRDGHPVKLPGERERAVLALLVLHAGEVVPSERIIDEVWGERAPHNPANALQAVVSRLRKVLGPEVVTTRKPGYAVELDPEQIDARRFEHLLRRARERLPGAPKEASRLLDEALALWRGEPLADLVLEDLAPGEVARLKELRTAAIEEKAEADLALGRHQQVAAELEREVEAHPLRERLRAQLMLALYRSGRQGDAINAYHDARATLEEELGIDPGSELQQLYERILRQDVDLETPPTVGMRATGNLPARITSFVGREREVAAVAEVLAANRIVTITGPGGAGKTSLAIEVGHEVEAGFSRGAWLVELAPIVDPSLVTGTVADALDLRAEGADEARSQIEMVVGFLRHKEVLLILDNCEHLVQEVARLTRTLLRACPHLTVLATSREVLGLTGEVVWTIPPLEVPRAGADPGDVASCEAVRLFAQRAAAAHPGFVVDDDNAGDVSQICRRLDGMPLAIELAAARTRFLPVREIASRLADRFALLTASGRAAEARHRTLRAAIDWSHDLLDEVERVAFRRLAVFAGGWDLEAAEAVVGGEEGVANVFDVVAGLVDRSLVVPLDDARTRYGMLDTLRQYAREKLEAAGETEEFERRHAYHYLSMAQTAEEALRGPKQAEWLARLSVERANLRAALVWGISHHEEDFSLELAAALGWFWFFQRQEEGREFLERVLKGHGRAGSSARARALQAYSVVNRPGACVVHPSPVCALAARESLELFDAAGDRARAALSKVLVAVEGAGGAEMEASLELIAEAMAEFDALDDPWGRALCHFVAMEIRFRRAERDRALADARAAIDGFEALGDRWGTSAVRAHLGGALWLAGDAEGALEAFEAALAEARRVGLPITTQWMLAYLGLTCIERGEFDGARRRFDEARRAAEEAGVGPAAAFADLGEGLIARLEGNLEAAAALLRRAFERFDRQGVPIGVAWSLRHLGTCEELLGEVERAETTLARAVDAALATGEPATVAGALEARAAAMTRLGRHEEAAALLGTAAAARARAPRPAWPGDLEDLRRAEEDARRALGARFEAAFEQGTRREPG